jgi:uncharacterized protein (DUF433 family)
MALSVIEPEEPPLRTDADGVLRIGRTRVPLETVVIVFNRGATPEEIVQQYSALRLSDVYFVIAHYLQNREALDVYFAQQRAQGEQVRRENEARFDPVGIRERLLARRQPNE